MFRLDRKSFLFCPAVRELNLSFCFRLGTDQIQHMVDSLPRLETLTLVKCPLFEYLVIDSPTLRVLNVNYCSALRGIKLSCPALQRMENFACISLCQLTIESADALEYLELSGLPISRLELTSRRLAHLELENCRRLDHCISRCPALQRVNLIGSRMVVLRFCKEVRSVMMQNWSWVVGTLRLDNDGRRVKNTMSTSGLHFHLLCCYIAPSVMLRIRRSGELQACDMYQ
jgi:hypothetical protein